PMGPIIPKGMEMATESYRLISVAEPAMTSAPGSADAASVAGRRLCSNCGEDNAETQRFCGMCGTPLKSVAKTQESRKTVTLVFADPKPRTDSGDPPSPEALREVMLS